MGCLRTEVHIPIDLIKRFESGYIPDDFEKVKTEHLASLDLQCYVAWKEEKERASAVTHVGFHRIYIRKDETKEIALHESACLIGAHHHDNDCVMLTFTTTSNNRDRDDTETRIYTVVDSEQVIDSKHRMSNGGTVVGMAYTYGVNVAPLYVIELKKPDPINALADMLFGPQRDPNGN